MHDVSNLLILTYLQGGYFSKSLAESEMHMLRAVLDDPLVPLAPQTCAPHPRRVHLLTNRNIPYIRNSILYTTVLCTTRAVQTVGPGPKFGPLTDFLWAL